MRLSLWRSRESSVAYGLNTERFCLAASVSYSLHVVFLVELSIILNCRAAPAAREVNAIACKRERENYQIYLLSN